MEASDTNVGQRKKQAQHHEKVNEGHLKRGGAALIRDERIFMAHKPTSTGQRMQHVATLTPVLETTLSMSITIRPAPAHSPNIRNQSPARCFITGILRAVAPKQVFFVKNSAYLDADMQDQHDHCYRCQVLQHYTQYRDFFCEIEWVLDPSIRTGLHHRTRLWHQTERPA